MAEFSVKFSLCLGGVVRGAGDSLTVLSFYKQTLWPLLGFIQASDCPSQPISWFKQDWEDS